jgi:hypothetical protein
MSVSGREGAGVPQPFAGGGARRLRLQVTYASGTVRILLPAFRDRTHLDKVRRTVAP